jgi:hypothetical protein
VLSFGELLFDTLGRILQQEKSEKEERARERVRDVAFVGIDVSVDGFNVTFVRPEVAEKTLVLSRSVFRPMGILQLREREMKERVCQYWI